MKLRKSTVILGCTALLLQLAQVQAAPSLVSLKRGHEGSRYWAAFVFDENARWLSISQPKNGQVSIYFNGDAKDKDGQRLTLGDGQCALTVEQVSRNPLVFKSSMQCSEAYPVAVIRRSNTVVVGLNDPRLLSQSTKAGSGGGQYVELISVSEQKQTAGTETRFQFSADFDWLGYFKTSDRQVTLLFSGVSNMSPVDNYMLNNEIVRNVNLSTDYNNPEVLKINVDLASNAAYTISKKGSDLVISGTVGASDAALTEEILRPQEASPAMWEEDTGSGYGEGNFYAQEANASAMPAGSYQNSSNRSSDVWTMPNTTDGRDSNIPWDKMVSFEFNEMSIKDALRLIAKTNNINMVVGETVSGTITMNLQNVTLRQAIERILHPRNMEYLVKDDIITVKPVSIQFQGGMQTKVYRLRYADANNVVKVLKRVASDDSLVEVFSTEFLDFATSGTNRMSAAGVGVQGIRRSSMLVVTDRPEKIQEIDAIIQELDRPPTQIMIESKLVEVAPNYSENLGIDWDRTLGAYLQNSKNLTGGGNDKMLQVYDGNDAAWYEGTWKMGRLTASQYTAVLDVLKEKTDATLRLNPRILAMNDEESSISVGTTVPIPEVQQSSGSLSERITFSYKEVNVQLNVTPHVGHNKEIVMYVNPVIEEISEWVEYGLQRAPMTTKRAVNSIVSIKNGETIVIGGLIKNQQIKIIKKVWLLGNLPLIGRFFQHSSLEDKQTDMMIFITPTIVEG
ncbi:hypothetical protein JW948_10880 [bacterium]|nr:hypothetical protein [bacterium]